MSENLVLEIIKGVSAITVATVTVSGGVFATKFFNNKNKNNCNKLKITVHPVFTRAELNKNVILTYFILENKGKEILFKEILINHMDIYKKHMIILCSNISSNEDINSNKLHCESVDAINNIIYDLRTFYKNNTNYNDEENKVLDIVMAKYNKWNRDREFEIITRIQEICGSPFYPDIYTKTVTILDTFLFAMNSTVSDASKTLDSINGDLKGLVFRGVEI